ncbi:MAG: hypothetical protein CVU91_12275 [Firmicutes bacterium HGW-Firmicutes-16]|nr:MAG: hypothetical protein CVU91_12275 [Firmicutes bacterium HGW-Firmicutes-16]
MYKHVEKSHRGREIGIIVLGVWLTLTGVMQVFSLQIPFINTMLALLAIAAGVLLLFSRK